tara:strand:+ start:368 stop:709 length:342 start_codon:yes stop_codon:yes gene_type:complete
MRNMKIKNLLCVGIVFLAGLVSTLTATNLKIPNHQIKKFQPKSLVEVYRSKGYQLRKPKQTSLLQKYRGSSHERRLDAQIKAYAPSARKNAEVFGGRKLPPNYVPQIRIRHKR